MALKRFILTLFVASVLCPVVEAATLQRGLFEIRYDGSDEQYALASLDILEGALSEYSERLPAGEKPIRVIMSHTLQEFFRYAGPYTQPGVGGIAQSHAGLIVVKAPRLQQRRRDYPGMLRHELVHVLLARNTRPENLPRWLNEGIAMVLAREHRWGSWYRVARMYTQGRLFSYRELEFVFADASTELEFGDAYAQSLSMTRTLMDYLGEERFWVLIRLLDRVPFDEALQTQAGLTPDEFSERWQKSLWKLALIVFIVSGVSLFQVMAFLVLVAYWRKRRSRKRILRAWEEEEQEPVYVTWDEVVEPTPWESSEDEELR